jgi:hypothetical protein
MKTRKAEERSKNFASHPSNQKLPVDYSNKRSILVQEATLTSFPSQENRKAAKQTNPNTKYKTLHLPFE